MRMVVALRALGVTAAISAVAILGVTSISAADPRALGGPAVDACHDLGGSVQAGTLCHVRQDTDTYLMDIRFGVDYPDALPVVEYLYRQREALMGPVRAPGAQNLPYQLFITTQSFRSGQPLRILPSLGQQFPGAQTYGDPWQGTESMVLKTFLRLDITKEIPRYHYQTFNFDHNQNRALSFNDLFAPGSKPLEAIFPLMKAQLERLQQSRNFELSTKDGMDPSLYRNFAITDDALMIFIDQGRLVPDEAGDIVVTLPRIDIPPLQI